MPPSAKQETCRRAQNVGKVIVEPYEDLGNEVKMLALAFRKNHDKWILDEMEQLLKRTDADLAYRPLKANKGLRAFVDNDSSGFTEEDANALVTEVTSLWPDIEHMSTERVKTLKRLMDQHKHLDILQSVLRSGMVI
ncbi:hypothetical protein LTR10_019580 [Elasticomyces elasticus]|uniref:Uncharacterized protein n=1 Tax=Exophiala sideris TaxID=1016849 RepID=A0ABR0JQP5_9EURO|nr:hypothetical protein LTR10_019580 [Elasticomyces elasticus]KAK5038152.1 hypothetical protein LTS07_001621 [Exophiala sideris]KAK5044136.1 hypothetical protein LTR13_000492 [Exophiala sideris]KAK5067636.1 hypothetical protein LTR69_001625 [Exophiala sideris]KAK5184123.1 hypothetical protein LTR44_003629 [Eurotiomycetes sp. CCFEE 6388]